MYSTTTTATAVREAVPTVTVTLGKQRVEASQVNPQENTPILARVYFTSPKGAAMVGLVYRDSPGLIFYNLVGKMNGFKSAPVSGFSC